MYEGSSLTITIWGMFAVCPLAKHVVEFLKVLLCQVALERKGQGVGSIIMLAGRGRVFNVAGGRVVNELKRLQLVQDSESLGRAPR